MDFANCSVPGNVCAIDNKGYIMHNNNKQLCIDAHYYV